MVTGEEVKGKMTRRGTDFLKDFYEIRVIRGPLSEHKDRDELF
jgi:hypothetical protein